MVTEKRDERVPSVSDDIIRIDMSKLDSPLGKAKSSNNMLEMMTENLKMKQVHAMTQDLESDENRKRINDAKVEAIELAALKGTQTPQQPAQNAPNVADALKIVLTPEFLVAYAGMDAETKKMIMQMVMVSGMSGGAQGNNMLPMLMMMQQQQKPEPKIADISGKDLVTSLTEGIKLGRGDGQGNSPVEMFKVMKDIVAPYQTNAQDLQTQLLREQLNAIKEQSQPMTFDKTIEMIKTTNDMFGPHQGASDQDVQIAALTAETRLKEYRLNLDARKIAEEAKTENMKWQQIGGLLTSVASAAAPTILNAVSSGVLGMGQAQQAAAAMGAQAHDASSMRHAMLTCGNCGGTFEINSNPDGTFKNKARCPHCKDILDVDIDGEEDAGA